MAIGDPWDTSYDPREYDVSRYDWMLADHNTSSSYIIKNNWTHRIHWGPDHSYLIPQKDPSTLHDRRGGRFCTEGCGCVNTGSSHPFQPTATTILPQQLAITVARDGGLGDHKDRGLLSGTFSSKDYYDTIVLQYSSGAWRGRFPCLPISDFDSCRYTSSRNDSIDNSNDYPRSRPSDCHWANSRFEPKNNEDAGDFLDPAHFMEFTGGIDEDGIWSFSRRRNPSQQEYNRAVNQNAGTTPRYIEDYYIKEHGYPDGKVHDYYWEDKLTGRNGTFDHLYSQEGYCSDHRAGTEQECLALKGDWESLVSPVDVNHSIYYNKFDHENLFTADEERLDRLRVAVDGYVGLIEINSYENTTGQESDQFIYHDAAEHTLPCIVDGFTPLLKRPHCRDPITGSKIQQVCENTTHKNPKDCKSHGTCDSLDGSVTEEECTDADSNAEWIAHKWLYADEESCTSKGHCTKEVDLIETGLDKESTIVKPYCLDIASGESVEISEENCISPSYEWVLADLDSCESRWGKNEDAYCWNKKTFDKEDATDKLTCEENKNNVWRQNKFRSNEWIEDQYEKESCCGKHIVDQNHASRTPQFAGKMKTSADGIFTKDSNLENPTCFSPYQEYVLLPPEVPAINQWDREPLYVKNIQGKNTFWTLLIRPCRFWESCFEEGKFSGSNKDGGDCIGTSSSDEDKKIYKWNINDQKSCENLNNDDVVRPSGEEDLTYIWASRANEFRTGCGEEIVLRIPTNQMLNDSNFNLTISDEETPKGAEYTGLDTVTKRDMSKTYHGSFWRETQPMWDLKYGLHDKVYEWWNISGAGDPFINPVTFLSGPFPSDAINKHVYDWWCRDPDADRDGVADGATTHVRRDDYGLDQSPYCNNFVYSYGVGFERSYINSLNPKGADTFSKFNLQPQPFKATEEKQLRAKTIEQAKVDYVIWNQCISRKHAGNTAGHWFVNYGQDYFLYFDWNSGARDADYEAHCDDVSTKFNDWVKGHVGYLGIGECTRMNAVGWIPHLDNNMDQYHPCGFPYTETVSTGEETTIYGCGGVDESTCPTAGFCKQDDGSFERGTDESSCTGEWTPCCAYVKTCIGPDGKRDAKVVVGYKPGTTEYQYGGVAEDKEECERPIDNAIENLNADGSFGDPGAGGEWLEECVNSFETGTCHEAQGIPDGLADIAFGTPQGFCEKEGEEGKETDRETCDAEGGTFTQHDVGHYAKRQGPYIAPVKPVGTGDESNLIRGLNEGVPVWYDEDDIPYEDFLAIQSEKGTSPDYWERTGLYPIHEQQISFINDTCIGTRGSGRVQFASNEKPIKITSPSHNLRDGDLIDIRDVLGNFAANVMTNREWTETQWEEKRYRPFNTQNEEVIINPYSSCPYDDDGTCPDDYYACFGYVVDGKKPDPAPFFIAKNVLPDTFELYTCAKEPMDGTFLCEDAELPPTLEWYSVYGHLKNIAVEEGDTILKKGEIGTVSDLLTTWDHLHFAVGEATKDPQPLRLFAKGLVNGISFDTEYEGRACSNSYPNEADRVKTETETLELDQLDEIRGFLDFGSLLEDAGEGYEWVDSTYSIAHTLEAYFAIDFQTHDSSNCTAASIVNQSINGKGKKVYNPFADSDEDGNMIITQVVAAETNLGVVVLKHILQDMDAGDQEQLAVTAYSSCPFTGKWETWQEPTLEDAYNMNMGDPQFDYRAGFSGRSFKWDYRANGFYVGIEQKGICPVCNDHYMPENLHATFTTGSSQYLNVSNCQINPCYEPNVCIDDTSDGSRGVEDFDILFGVQDYICVVKGTSTPADKSESECKSEPDLYEWKKDPAAAKERCVNEQNIWVGEDWWNYGTADGWCCSDPYYHPCVLYRTDQVCVDAQNVPNYSLSNETDCEEIDGNTWTTISYDDLEDCKNNFWNYGRCEKDGKTAWQAYTSGNCTRIGGSFTPLTTSDHCETFLRRRINNQGTTNCRRCSDVFSDESGVPIQYKADTRSGYYDGDEWIPNDQIKDTAILDKNGDSCCFNNQEDEGEIVDCSCTANRDKHPDCTHFINIFGECDNSKLGSHTLGNLTGVCKEVEVEDDSCSKQTAEYTSTQPPPPMAGSWTETTPCGEPSCTSSPPSEDGEAGSVVAVTCTGVGQTVFMWQFDPCGCFPSNIAAKCEGDKIYASDPYGEASCDSQIPDSPFHDPTLARKESGPTYYHDNSGIGLNCGVTGDSDSTINFGGCYDQALAHQPVGSTCPGLNMSNVEYGEEEVVVSDLTYDGVVWRTPWKLMGTVGTHQCKNTGNPRTSHKFPFSNCNKDVTIEVADNLVYVNADCAGCDMPQLTRSGVPKKIDNGQVTEYRDAYDPKIPEDAHYMRLVLGCGNSIPSIEEGELRDGGFGPSPSTYQNDSMKLWAEITNCSYHDMITHENLKKMRMTHDVDGDPPCSGFPNLGGCTEWKQYYKNSDNELPLEYGDPDRKYMFAGKCVSQKTCGPKGPCVSTECCEYEGLDFGIGEDAIWNGAVACSTGGNISHICRTVGFEMGPKDKAKEVLTVHDIIDVNHITGAGTLVAKSHGGTCSYAAGTTVSIGMAGPAEAESSSKDDYTRNKQSANPFLRGTVLSETIRTPKEEEYGEDGKFIGYKRTNRANKFILIKVNDITPLINKNSRKDRHLRYNDIRYAPLNEYGDEIAGPVDKNIQLVEDIDKNETVNHQDDYDTPFTKGIALSDMIVNKELKYPYGNNPFPVATQTISGTTKSQMWPKGKDMGPDNLESLRSASSDYANDIEAPGRTGQLWRDSQSLPESIHSIIDSSKFAKKKDVAIDSFSNIYHPTIGECTDNKNYKTKEECEDNEHIWIPQFLNTLIQAPELAGTSSLSDKNINPKNYYEKIMISGTIAYKATCKGSRMGYCHKANGSGKGKNIKECADKDEFNDKEAGEWVEIFSDEEADMHICEEVFKGKWVIGKRNPDTDADPNNDEPLDLEEREKEFEDGCPPACAIKGFYTDKACTAFQQEVAPGEKRGECYECVSDEIPQEEGESTQWIRCPLTPIDGNHIISKVDIGTYLDTFILLEDQSPELDEGVHAYRERMLIGSSTASGKSAFILVDESHLTTNDEAKLYPKTISTREKVVVLDPVRRKKEFEFDPSRSSTPTSVGLDKDRFEGEITSLALPKDECDARPDHYHMNLMIYKSDNSININDTIKARVDQCINLNRFDGFLMTEGVSSRILMPNRTDIIEYDNNQLQLQALAEGTSLFSTQGYYDFLGDRFSGFYTSKTMTKTAGVYNYKQLIEACELSSVCHFSRTPFECRGGDSDTVGLCKTFKGDEDFETKFPTVTETKESECSGTFTYPKSLDLYSDDGQLNRKEEKECLEQGHQVIPTFLCYNLDEKKLSSKITSFECVNTDGDLLPDHTSKEDCVEAGGTWQTRTENMQSFGEFLETGENNLGDEETILTPQECEAAGGEVFYDGIFNNPSTRPNNLHVREVTNYTIKKDWRYFTEPTNTFKSRDLLTHDISEVSSVPNEFGKDTYKVGKEIHGITIHPPKRRWKGLIYAYDIPSHMSQKDKEDYSKYVVPTDLGTTGSAGTDTPSTIENTYVNFYNGAPAYWSRHGGAFDITISQKLPEHGGRHANSNKPVNLDFWLEFPQICCNMRGPQNYWGCPEDPYCFPHANGTMGPILDHLEYEYGIQGSSLIHVNITEKIDVLGGGGVKGG